MGHLFQYEVDILSQDANIKLQDLLGQPLTVRLQLDNNESRHFHGYVSRFCQTGMLGKFYAYQASVRPWFWFLTRTSNCRIFQEKTVPEIIMQVFRDHGFSDFDDLLNDNYRTWEYCVQYRETDYHFVSRLLEQEGIYYYFKHDENTHTLVLSDSSGSHTPISNYEEIPYYALHDHRRAEIEHIYDWFVAQEVQTSTYILNDYNFKTPRANLEVKLSQFYEYENSQFEIFDYPGEYTSFAEGESYVRKRIEELNTQYEIIRGQTNARGLAVGALFSLNNFPRNDQNRKYLVISANYEIISNQYESGSESDGTTFRCNFSAINSEIEFRTPRETRQPKVQGPQTATVVGKSGEEIWTDKYGRVKVQFHWDREGKSDENSSCWIRVSHPTAGKSWGAVSIPRIGQEVIVDFLEGDPDRPIITGRVYNDIEKPPYPLPSGAMVSGMKSNSTPGGGGYNEMSMNDTKGEEKINIHAQYDMDTTVENDQSSTINNNRTTAVVVDDALTVDGNRTIQIKGSLSENIDSGQQINVTSGYEETISGGATSTIDGGLTTIVTGAIEQSATDTMDLSATGAGTYTSDDSLKLEVGGSKIEVKPDSITISASGSTITVDAMGVAINGAKIALNG